MHAFICYLHCLQKSAAFKKLNPAGLVPALVHGRTLLTESMAVLEFLEDEYPGTKRLFGGDSYERAEIRAQCMTVSVAADAANVVFLEFDRISVNFAEIPWSFLYFPLIFQVVSGIQPLQNVGTLAHIVRLGLGGEEWAQHFIAKGFDTLERRLERSSGQYSVGDSVSAADCCLVPQVYNAVK